MMVDEEDDGADIQIGVFSLWVKDGPDAEDWVQVSVACKAPSATITTSGPILQLSDLRRWLSELDGMNQMLKENARLCGAEPNLDLSFTMTKTGNISACLQITPDSFRQLHKITFDCDQSYLPKLINQLKVTIAKCSKNNT